MTNSHSILSICDLNSINLSTSTLRQKCFWSAASALLVVLITPMAGVPQTLHQLFNVNPEGTNTLGVRYFAGSFGVSPADPNFGPIATDGQSILLFDKNEYVRRLHTLGFPTDSEPFYNTELRLPFVGSGLDMIQLNNVVGEDYEWEVVDSGSNNTFNIVASGISSTASATITAQTVNLVPQGTLPTDRIHILRVRALDSDGLHATQGGKWRVILDAVRVYDDVPLAFDDDSNVSGNWTYSSGWQQGLDFNVYEGTRTATNTPAETVSINFTGTSIVVLGFASNSGAIGGIFGTGPSFSGTYTWQIDGGAGGSGIIDQSIDHNFAVRWPELLVNGLSPGPHTLEITVVGANSAPSADYNNNSVIDAADYVVWRKHLGTSFTLPNENPNATTPGEVDQEDYDFWNLNFGGTGGAMFVPNGGFVQLDAIAVLNPPVIVTGATLNVPEPSTTSIFITAWVAILGFRKPRHGISHSQQLRD